MENTTLSLLQKSYLMLQRLSNESVRVALETDGLRASLRDKISELTGQDSQYVQEETESFAFMYPIKPFIQIRSHNEFENKAFWLDDGYNWELKKDSEGELVLIPTKK